MLGSEAMMIRVATWNLDRIGTRIPSRRDAILQEMKNVAPDIWVLTETCDSFSPPGAEYNLIAHTADAPDLVVEKNERWVAIWSKMAAEPVEIFVDGQRLAAIRTTGAESVLVIGTVLPFHGDEHVTAAGATGYIPALGEQESVWRRLLEDAPYAG
jgi:hypothetical protein